MRRPASTPGNEVNILAADAVDLASLDNVIYYVR